MKERPILFSGAMVRALLAGTKTQTRRVVKPTRGRPIEFLGGGPRGGADWNNPQCWGYEWHDGPEFVTLEPMEDGQAYPCPYGQPGDRLWVRETHLIVGGPSAKNPRYVYRASNDGPDGWLSPAWRPSIHMPRAASRITLEITGIRVERLTAISEADALAEGVRTWAAEQDTPVQDLDEARLQFRALWTEINGGESWDADPWCWVVEFKRVEATHA